MPLEVPVEPDAAQARRWASEELARRIYDERTGLLERGLAWLLERLDDLVRLTSADGGWVVPALAVLVTATVATAGAVLGRPGRRRRPRSEPGGVLDGEERTDAALRASADAAARRGDHATAVLDRFRALVRSLTDRAVLDAGPGLTAHEAVSGAARRFPGRGADLHRAGDLFDRVRYGRGVADARDDAFLRELDAALAAARPAPAPPSPAPTGPVP